MNHFPAVRFLDRTTPPHIATLILLAGMSAMAMNVFLPSLPGMAEYYQVDYAFMQLSVALYLGVNAVMQLFVGPLSDRYGRRPVLLWGTGLFCLATLGCVLAPTGEIFMAFRMLQAVIAVAIVLSRAVVRDMYPQDKAASVMGYVTMGMSLVPMLAPALGGVLDTWFGWQASFELLLICGIAVFALIWFDQGETARQTGTPMKQQIKEYPEIFRSHRFWGYALATALGSGAFFAYLGGGPYLGTEVFNIPTEELGLWLATPGIGYFLGNFISGRFSARYGVNRMVLSGTLIVTAGLLVAYGFSLAGSGTAITFFGSMIFVGIGNGMTIPNASAGMLSVRPHLAGTASGLGSTIMIGGGAALSAFAGVILEGSSNDLPLMSLMTLVSALSVLCILYVIYRDKKLGG